MIAVITPVYNGALSIQKSIESLLNQSYNNWINIIVNDGSTDETHSILESYQHDSRFIIIHLPENKGRGFARNIALKKAKEINATYMCMLDADDQYHPEKLADQFSYMEAKKDLVLSSSSIGVVNEKGLYRINEICGKEQHFQFSTYESITNLPHASSIIRLSMVNVNFNMNMKFAEDQDFMRRLLIGKKYSFVPKILYYYNRDESFSISKYKQSLNADLYSFNLLNVNKSFLIKLQIINSIKIVIFFLLTIVKLEKLYYNRIGRKPTNNEMFFFESNNT